MRTRETENIPQMRLRLLPVLWQIHVGTRTRKTRHCEIVRIPVWKLEAMCASSPLDHREIPINPYREEKFMVPILHDARQHIGRKHSRGTHLHSRHVSIVGTSLKPPKEVLRTCPYQDTSSPSAMWVKTISSPARLNPLTRFSRSTICR